ncbi:MAG: HD domain-containing protein [Candidatus Omnitrophota bacterium]
MHIFLIDLKEGQYIESTYLVRERSFDTAKNGSPYISLELSDSTGMVDGRMWDASKSIFDSFGVDEFIKVRGRVELYKKYPQLKIDSIEKVDPALLDISLYLPTTDRDIGEMFRSFKQNIDAVKNPYLKKLLNNIFLNKDISECFKKAPAATDFHHPYIGGLLEHTLNCLELAKVISSMYPDINMDILITGTALHDIGKIEELSYKRSFYYTDKGRLLGHIVIGAGMAEREMDRIPGFPDDLKSLIIHIVLSHHGEQAWGSPKRPMMLEAIVLHHIDNLDAKVNGFRQFVSTYNDPGSNWTKHSKMFGEFLYKKNISESLDNGPNKERA